MEKFIRTYEDAFRIAKDYGPSEEALQNTLKYIYEKSYACYMLCVKDGNAHLYKLESKIGNASLDKQINKTLKRKKIKSATKTWRVMGCIVKPFKKESTFAKEWLPFLESVQNNLPDGIFILTLSDSVLLPLSVSSSFVPMFSYSGKRGYRDIPIPTYDDLFDREIGDVETTWSKKKSVAVFRGGSTGCGGTTDTNQRLKLATMRSDALDVGITQYTSHLKYNSSSDIEKVEKVAPVVPKLDWKQQSEYKYIIHVDGNVVAYRLLKSMLTKSLLLRVKSDFVHWTDEQLKDGEHYVSVKSDLSDLQEKVNWCKDHDEECKKIATNGYKFAKKVLTDEFIRKEFITILKSSTAYRTQDM
jgi:hypothetical protein